MVSPLPKWEMKRYAILWNRFKSKEFAHEQASKVLGDDKKLVSVFLSDLKKAGWLEVNLDSKDTRKRTYKLKEPNLAVQELKK